MAEKPVKAPAETAPEPIDTAAEFNQYIRQLDGSMKVIGRNPVPSAQVKGR
jgi:hypothetical protein